MLNNSNCSNDNNLDRINESCCVCRKHITKIKDILVGIDDDKYYHAHCAKELHITVTICRDIL